MTKDTVYSIGDRVVIKAYKDIDPMLRTKGSARLCGMVGTITDKLYSEQIDKFVYRVQFDDYIKESCKLWTDDFFVPYSNPIVSYEYEFDVLDNMVVARFYEIVGDEKTEIARGHGHIIHEGAIGIAQASSYALKKILEKMNGGLLT